MVPLFVSTLSYLAYFVNITCFSAILLLSLSHIPPASDPPPPPHLPCGPAPVLTGEDEALAATRKLPAVALSATRGVERGAGFGFDHHFLDLGAEPRLHVIRDGLQNSRLFDRDNLPETLDYCGLDALRVLRGQFAVLPRASRLLHQRLVRFLDECVERTLHLFNGAQFAQPFVAHSQVRKRRSDQRDESRGEHRDQGKNHVICKLMPIEHVFSSLDDDPRNEKHCQHQSADGDNALYDVIDVHVLTPRTRCNVACARSSSRIACTTTGPCRR